MKKFNVTGMSCAACSNRVEKAVSSLNEVEECSVNLLTGTMCVKGTADESVIIDAVEKAGYGASVMGDERTSSVTQKNKEEEQDKQKVTSLKNRFIFSLVVLIALMYFSMGYTMFHFPVPGFFEKSPCAVALLQMILSAIIMIANQTFFINGFKSIINLAPNMDSLVSLGSMSAFLYSTVMLFEMLISESADLHGLYFESAAMVLTLITLGKMLEAKAKGKTTSAIKGLMDLTPKMANVIRDGKEIKIKVEDVVVGDIFIIKPGESVPVDGIVTWGESLIDESALTGESIPASKTVGSKVSAATINTSGILKCKATHVGNDTTLANIIKIVNDASASKAPIAKIADKVSGIFVPVVIVIAIITLTSWLFIGKDFGFSLARAISVLVISCPCALGLATPVAIMVGSGLGAKNGVLFKTATSLELTGKAKCIAFDKTGTITKGMPTVTDILVHPEHSENDLIKIAYALENNSEHPLSKAITGYAKEKDISVETITEFKIIPGKGLYGKLDGKSAYGGNYEYISSIIKVPEDFIKKSLELANHGKTPLFFCYDNEFLGIIAVADALKDDSKEALNKLKSMGFLTVMITGDNKRTADTIAKEVGIDKVFADVLPDQKEKIVRELKKHGTVIMVGDGINDAPALTSADVGIAISAGSDIAIDAADVVIMKNKISDVVSAIKLSKYVLRNIRQNLLWAFSYNIIGIPLAAGLFIPFGFTLNPMFGAAAMSISSFLVVSNALRLNFVKINNIKGKKEKKKMQKVIKIEGMMCVHCEARVKKLLEELNEVETSEVSHEKGTAVLSLSSEIDDAKLKSIIEEQGYKVIEIK